MRNIQLFTQNHTLRKSQNCDLSQSLLSAESRTWTSSLFKRDASIIKEPSVVWDTCRCKKLVSVEELEAIQSMVGPMMTSVFHK